MLNRENVSKCAFDENGCGECLDGFVSFFFFNSFSESSSFFIFVFRFKREELTTMNRFQCKPIQRKPPSLETNIISFLDQLIENNKKFIKSGIEKKLWMERNLIFRSLKKSIRKNRKQTKN
jgi:hypothetical protein